MSNDARDWQNSMFARWALLSIALLSTTGCGGCSNDPAKPNATADEKQTPEDLEKQLAERGKTKKKKPDFEIGKLTPLLSQQIIDAIESEPLQLVKPGHWTATVQQMLANYDDFSGRTVVAPVDSKKFRPLVLPHLPFSLVSNRAVVLAKKQPKWIENEVFIPTEAGPKLHVSAHVERAESGSLVGDPETQTPLWSSMPSHQYFFLVLAREADRYAYLKVTDAIRGPWEDDSGTHSQYYRVVLADGRKRLPLPPNVLTWTSVAYILWDEVNLDRLDVDQQQALVDWLHWGGRLIVNGPDSLDSLRGSFLNDYLPADPGDALRLTEQRLAPLATHWGKRHARAKSYTAIKPTQPWSGVELKLRDGGRYIEDTGELICERNVGLGSVVVSAMQLSERDFINWPGYDGFLNGVLLGRPSRKFDEGPFVAYRANWVEHPERRLDAYFSTPMRWFARDAGTEANVKSRETNPAQAAWQDPFARPAPDVMDSPYEADRRGGLGSWSEFTPLSVAARAALREAAGVRVPGASFVVVCLSFYLLVLVPLNWMVFHAIGKIEWAWLAAPLIALVGTVVIVYQANLDIGFVRSRTEIAVLELQGDHSRGHLTRYAALYASLSTTYDMEFDNGTAVAKPFPPDDEFELKLGDSTSIVNFEKYDKTRLEGVQITSASTRFVHSEEMIELDGGLRWGTSSINSEQIENRTGFNLQDAAIVRRRFGKEGGKPTVDAFWIGQLRAGEARAVPFSPLALSADRLPFAAERAAAAKIDSHPRLDVDAILQAAFQFTPSTDPHHARRDEWRLIARVDEILPGAVVNPDPSQTVGTTVVLAHLAHGPRRDQQPDVNSAGDVAPPKGRRILGSTPFE